MTRVLPGETLRENLPASLVLVPPIPFLTDTETFDNGLPVSSVTEPVTVFACPKTRTGKRNNTSKPVNFTRVTGYMQAICSNRISNNFFWLIKFGLKQKAG